MRRFVAIVTVVSCGASQAARPAEVAPRVPVFYVATRGDDRSTGSEDAPFATLARARDAARAKRGAREIIVRGGTYFLAAPLVLAPEDSGLVIRAFPGERVVLSGGTRIEGFHETDVNGRRAWTAIVPGVKEGRAYFRELFVNRERRPRTRLPKSGYFHPTELPDVPAAGPFGKESKWLEGQRRFRFAPAI